MLSRLARGRRSLTRQQLLWLPHVEIKAAGLHRVVERPTLLLIPGGVL